MTVWEHQKDLGGKMKKFLFLAMTITLYFSTILVCSADEENHNAELVKKITKENIAQLSVIKGLEYCGFNEQSADLTKAWAEGRLMSPDISDDDLQMYSGLLLSYQSGFSAGYSAAMRVEKVLGDEIMHSNEGCKVVLYLMKKISDE